MTGFVIDWLPYVVLVVVYFALSAWITRRKQRRDAAHAKEIQDSMIAEYERRHGGAGKSRDDAA